MTHNIFISYSRKDIGIVRTIKTEIEQATKVECWMDLDGIVSGKPSFTNAIVDAINTCPIFLFMLSRNSQQSEYALKELDFAYKKHREENKHVVIIFIEDCQMTDYFSFEYQKADSIIWTDLLQRQKLLGNLKQWAQEVKSSNIHADDSMVMEGDRNDRNGGQKESFKKRNFSLNLMLSSKSGCAFSVILMIFIGFVFIPRLFLYTSPPSSAKRSGSDDEADFVDTELPDVCDIPEECVIDPYDSTILYVADSVGEDLY